MSFASSAHAVVLVGFSISLCLQRAHRCKDDHVWDSSATVCVVGNLCFAQAQPSLQKPIVAID